MDSTRPTPVLLEHVGPLTWVTLNRPDRLNAMTEEMLDELERALALLERRAETRVLGIRGSGRDFCSGHDVASDEHVIGGADSRDIAADQAWLAAKISQFMRLWDFPKPVIAAVHGRCLGSATQLTALCDITIVADDANFGLPTLPIGGGYITPIWVPFVGPKRAKQMAFQPGSSIDAGTAVAWGLANYAVPSDLLFEHVTQLATNIARTPYEVLRIKKLAINRAADLQGLRNIVPIGAEMDALLHYSEAVHDQIAVIAEVGLKEAIRRFNESAAPVREATVLNPPAH